MINQERFTNSFPGKVFVTQIKNFENPGDK